MSVSAELERVVRDWIAIDPDAATRRELEQLLADGDAATLTERFDGRVAFGTAGLRSGMFAGPTGMNRLVVRQAAAGIARYLLADVADARLRGVVITHDARHNSAEFAAEAAGVIAAHAIPVVLADRPWPTPVGVFAVRHLGAAAGIVVTASHNPASDNGLKLFMGDGAQIAPPTDEAVAAMIDAVVADGIIAPIATSASITQLELGVVHAYRDAVLGRVPRPGKQIPIAITAMHGVGGALLHDVLAAAGHQTVTVVQEQQHPDPDFPTVAFPNPEEVGATDLLVTRMRHDGAVLGLALDPDADRVAVCIRHGDRIRQLTGDEVGCLLAEWLVDEVTDGADRLLVTTVVSSSRLRRIAERHGVQYHETLTGFKWLARPALAHPELRQVLAYEEAIGYAVGADVFDKDGIGAALAVAAMAADAAGDGATLQDRLDALDRTYGAHVTSNFSLRYEGLGWRERRDATVAALVTTPPQAIGDAAILQVERLAPDVLRILLAGVRVLIRPSGTEPKLKCYCEAVEPVSDGDLDAARLRAQARLAQIREALTGLLS